MTPVDLHCHSNVSDGLLPPREVVRKAFERGCQLFALTDHDDVRGLPDAADEAARLGMRFISGVEISVSWGKHTLHIVGLGFDPEHPAIVEGLAAVRSGRAERGERMAASLAAVGIEGVLEGARKYADNPEMISRTHFARYLVEAGKAKDTKSVFKKFLVRGKPGYVEHEWARLHEAIEWIREAGGVAVLAHPGRYELGNETLRVLLTEYRRLGGEAIEVVSGSHGAADVGRFSRLAQEFGFLASCGTDYHATGEGAREPGLNADLPIGCEPVWTRWWTPSTTNLP
ncbi:3',5'-nucleoside bisphosphate phosphatase [Jeongeupia naejangsanensis]|uniref:PHP domain-containing protein n=1 Tax=Jeongeupia naejangsanensis TaxID=613195 RepID=A0ABS2BFP4_9NEIS|nr:3',5'-nucleoside bisphosphate phosphatase [Jeongeupia naejangsanensis]MBM3114437.1 PHP domain-containing protein [Jeongeupia naejangsanensis]